MRGRVPVAPEFRLERAAELLFRQASPGWIQEGRPSSRLFLPRPTDHGQVSVDREDVVGTAAASRAASERRGFNTGGTWGASVGEANAQLVDAYGDPTRNNAAHAVIDFAPIAEAQHQTVADRLRDAAVRRGQLA